MGKPEAIKRKRSENWSKEDKVLLKELIRRKVKTIENKNTDSNTNNSKKRAWIEVAENFNSLCVGGHRTVTQLRNQWMSTKMAAKKQISERRKEFLKTGGGTLPLEEPVSSEDITVWLPNEFVIDSNEFDSDAVIRETVENASTKNENNDGCLDETGKTQSAENVEKNAASPLPLIKKSHGKKTQEHHHIKYMVEFDIKCREELHQKQLEVENAKIEVEKAKLEVEKAKLDVEKTKLRNLNLEHQLINEKMYCYNKYSADKQ